MDIRLQMPVVRAVGSLALNTDLYEMDTVPERAGSNGPTEVEEEFTPHAPEGSQRPRRKSRARGSTPVGEDKGVESTLPANPRGIKRKNPNADLFRKRRPKGKLGSLEMLTRPPPVKAIAKKAKRKI